MQKKIKLLFEQYKGRYLSGEYIARNLHISRAAVWKHIRSMKSNGYQILGKRRKGYKLLSSNGGSDLKKFSFKNIKVLYFDKIGSTQARAKKIAVSVSKGNRPTLLIARTQFSSYGRMKRTWISPPGGLWFSLILKPQCIPSKASALTLLMGLSIIQVLNKLCPQQKFIIKWPNDILANNKKLCGIITEVQTEMDTVAWLVIGVGLNVNNSIPNQLTGAATSLSKETNTTFDTPRLLSGILSMFFSQYNTFSHKGWAPFIVQYRKYSVVHNKYVVVKSGTEKISGTVCGMDEAGGLILKTSRNSLVPVHSGEVILY